MITSVFGTTLRRLAIIEVCTQAHLEFEMYWRASQNAPLQPGEKYGADGGMPRMRHISHQLPGSPSEPSEPNGASNGPGVQHTAKSRLLGVNVQDPARLGIRSSTAVHVWAELELWVTVDWKAFDQGCVPRAVNEIKIEYGIEPEDCLLNMSSRNWALTSLVNECGQVSGRGVKLKLYTELEHTKLGLSRNGGSKELGPELEGAWRRRRRDHGDSDEGHGDRDDGTGAEAEPEGEG
ncbi:hypothetical protein FB451DRAFT_1180924 [Mycena latifolia]|nr:hypothetical protein FB451DRAFT_1180924 [Mycena latifolia]